MPSALEKSDPLHRLFRAFRARDNADIARVAAERPCIASDLSLGAWRGHWIGHELTTQLGIDLPADKRPVPGSVQEAAIAVNRTVAQLIDIETEGDRSVLIAHQTASAISAGCVEHGIGRILILCPKWTEDWMREDLWLLRFLNRTEAGFDVALVLTGEAEPPPLPLIWEDIPETEAAPAELLCIGTDAPGLAQTAEHGAAVNGIEIFDGWALILPEARGDAAPPASDSPAWLAAYHQTRLPVHERDIETLSFGASRCFAEGGYRQAVRLLEAAEAAAVDPTTAARIASFAQSMRIACLDFAAASALPDPGETLPEDLRRDLSATKAWGLVMSGHPDRADPLFAHVLALSFPAAQDPLWLYLKNISALAKFRMGRFEEAFEIEHEIERDLACFDRPDWHLKYINSINLARLHRASQSLEQAEHYYRQAFAINVGLRSDSDQIYLNICQASLDEAMQKPARAFIAWLRAALHWLAMPAPEALAPRVATAMKAGQGYDLVSRASSYLYDRIMALSGQIGPPFANVLEHPLDPAPVFAHPSERTAAPDLALGAPGWGVLIAPQDGADAIRSDQRALAGLVARLLMLLSPGAPTLSSRCILVDGCFGTELPTGPEDLYALSLRHRVPEMRFGKQQLVLSPKLIWRLECASRVLPGAGLDQVLRDQEELVVSFRRSRQAIWLTPNDGRLLEYALQGVDVTDLARALGETEAVTLAHIRRLEQAGIIQLRPTMPNDAPTPIHS